MAWDLLQYKYCQFQRNPCCSSQSLVKTEYSILCSPQGPAHYDMMSRVFNKANKGLFDSKDFYRIFEGLESLGIFPMLIVWFVGLNPIGFFPKNSFVLHFTGILTSTQISWKKSFVFPHNQTNSNSIGLQWTCPSNPAFFLFLCFSNPMNQRDP